MIREHLEELKKIEHSYWWHVAERKAVTEILTKYFPAPAKLLEGGF